MAIGRDDVLFMAGPSLLETTMITRQGCALYLESFLLEHMAEISVVPEVKVVLLTATKNDGYMLHKWSVRMRFKGEERTVFTLRKDEISDHFTLAHIKVLNRKL